MSILNQLSSQVGDKTEESNLKVVKKCLPEPQLLKEIAEGLQSKDIKLVGDCAEVFTKIAEEKPGFVEPYVDYLTPLLENKNTRVRWEATHTISLITVLTPDKISPLIVTLFRNINNDQSTIVRDYSVDTLASYASASPKTAEEVYPYLVRSLDLWNNKHTHRSLMGLKNVALNLPKLKKEIRKIAEKYQDHPRGVLRKAAKDVLKAVND